MSNLPRRLNDAVDDLIAREISVPRRAVPARVEQAVIHAEAVVHGRGIVRAAHIRAQEYVTAEALRALDHLTDLEADSSQRKPDREDRFNAIVDISTAVMGNIVADDGRY